MFSNVTSIVPQAATGRNPVTGKTACTPSSNVSSNCLLKSISAFKFCCNQPVCSEVNVIPQKSPAYAPDPNVNQALLTAELNYGCCCGSCYIPYTGGANVNEDV